MSEIQRCMMVQEGNGAWDDDVQPKLRLRLPHPQRCISFVYTHVWASPSFPPSPLLYLVCGLDADCLGEVIVDGPAVVPEREGGREGGKGRIDEGRMELEKNKGGKCKEERQKREWRQCCYSLREMEKGLVQGGKPRHATCQEGREGGREGRREDRPPGKRNVPVGREDGLSCVCQPRRLQKLRHACSSCLVLGRGGQDLLQLALGVLHDTARHGGKGSSC